MWSTVCDLISLEAKEEKIMNKPTDEEVRATITDTAFLLMGDLQRIADRSGWPDDVVYNVFMKEFNKMWEKEEK